MPPSKSPTRRRARSPARANPPAAAPPQAKPSSTPFLIARATADAAKILVTKLAKQKLSLTVLIPVIAAYLFTKFHNPTLYAPPSCSQKPNVAPPGPLYITELYAFEFAWWLVLGILSSIGFGSGLHSGIMFLWPFVMKVIVTAEALGSTNFCAVYNHACVWSFTGTRNDGTLTYFNQLLKVWPAALVWGAGTAIGELPPYFVTRAARAAGRRDDAFEDELREARAKSDIVSRLKVWTIDFTERHGFLGIFLLASWPNAAFDMCGMACGWLQVPFWTFFGATLLGKSLVKTTIQSSVAIILFSNAFFEHVASAMGSIEGFLPISLNFTAKAVSLRQKVMYMFELQSRTSVASLLGPSGRPLDLVGLTTLYCRVQERCGSLRGHNWSNSGAFKEATEKAKRVIAHWDKIRPDGRLDADELAAARSGADGLVSLASLDAGSASFFSLGNLWNAFIACLILFFVHTIIQQVAHAQAAKEKAELKASKVKSAKQK